MEGRVNLARVRVRVVRRRVGVYGVCVWVRVRVGDQEKGRGVCVCVRVRGG